MIDEGDGRMTRNLRTDNPFGNLAV